MAHQVTTTEDFLAEKEIVEIALGIAEVLELQGDGEAVEILMTMVICLVEIAVLEPTAARVEILEAQEMIG